ncbi:hypothetical protein DY000_02021971 [Brassica cretica]|uniref:Uncharacterized protein n=1 Tax=Brassica cretica TaxID=69181 RepID=A0ABQ7EMA8_BRACR|nr:hypothetical protein DY000_02021971 [Brassica cretica]
MIDAIQMIPHMRSLMKGLVLGKITGDNGYNKMLDCAKSMEKLVAYLSLGEKDESNQSSTVGAAVPKRTSRTYNSTIHGAIGDSLFCGRVIKG